MKKKLMRTLREVMGKWVVYKDTEGRTRSARVLIPTPDKDMVVVREGERTKVIHMLDIVDAF